MGTSCESAYFRNPTSIGRERRARKPPVSLLCARRPARRSASPSVVFSRRLWYNNTSGQTHSKSQSIESGVAREPPIRGEASLAQEICERKSHERSLAERLDAHQRADGFGTFR